MKTLYHSILDNDEQVVQNIKDSTIVATISDLLKRDFNIDKFYVRYESSLNNHHPGIIYGHIMFKDEEDGRKLYVDEFDALLKERCEKFKKDLKSERLCSNVYVTYRPSSKRKLGAKSHMIIRFKIGDSDVHIDMQPTINTVVFYKEKITYMYTIFQLTYDPKVLDFDKYIKIEAIK